MLTFLGFAMVICCLYVIMARRLSALIALILVPFLFALFGGFAFKIGPMMLDGIGKLAPTGVMWMFAILYFALMTDSGLFDPAVRRLLRVTKGDPVKVSMGTAVLASVISLGGDSASTYLVGVAAMLPLYRRLGMSPRIMAGLIILCSGVMNMTPWSGPTAHAANALHLDPADISVPMLPAMLVGMLTILAIAWAYGKRERLRLGQLRLPDDAIEHSDISVSPFPDPRRPRLMLFNGLLTLTLMAALMGGLLPLPVLFMLAFSIALSVNYPSLDDQKQRLTVHAGTVLALVGLILAGASLCGILSGTGMVDAMSKSLLSAIPDELGPYLAVVTALVSLPFTFFMSNEAFFDATLPVLAQAAAHYGIAPVEMARAAIIGQPVHLLSPLVPSSYLLVALSGIEYGEHQCFSLKWAVLLCLCIMVTALLLGTFPFYSSL